jgi:hypothetical protein
MSEYDKARGKFTYLIDKWRRLVQSGGRLLLVTYGECSKDYAGRLAATLNAAYPQLDWHMLIAYPDGGQGDWGIPKVTNCRVKTSIPYIWRGDNTQWSRAFATVLAASGATPDTGVMAGPAPDPVDAADESLPQQAAAFFNSGRYEDARAMCLRILAVRPGHAQILCILGAIERQAGNLPLAVELMARAVVHDYPQGCEAILNNTAADALATSIQMINEGRFRDALDLLRQLRHLKIDGREIQNNIRFLFLFDCCVNDLSVQFDLFGLLDDDPPPATPGLVYDCFTFDDQLEILDKRLNALSSVVDRFVLVESGKTFQGDEKPLRFAENRERFAAFADRIVHVLANNVTASDTVERRKVFQRDAISGGLTRLRPNDMVIVSDIDEIPAASAITQARNHLYSPASTTRPICFVAGSQPRSVAVRGATFRRFTPQILWDLRGSLDEAERRFPGRSPFHRVGDIR